MSPPVFAHGHLRLYLLSLLAERSMHGYELIQALGERFGGTYVPSAGTIYPRLAKLEDDGLVTKEPDGRKTVYAITEAGRAELAARERELDGIESDVTDSVRRLADEVRASVTDAMRSLRADLAAAAREVRDETPASSPAPRASTEAGERMGERVRLHEAEAAITEFRNGLRTELRASAHGVNARAGIDDETLTLLREGLEELRRNVVARLRG